RSEPLGESERCSDRAQSPLKEGAPAPDAEGTAMNTAAIARVVVGPGAPAPGPTTTQSNSVPVVVGLVGTFDVDADVGGLLLGQLGELDPEGVEVEAGDLLVEVLRQGVHADRVLVGLGEQL